jgi:hypothetical protein
MGRTHRVVRHHLDAAVAERNRGLDRTRRAANPEKSREASRQSYWRNRERILAALRLSRSLNPEKGREANRRWRESNLDKHRENARRWHHQNPDRARENARRWHQENPDKWREHNRRRKSILRSSRRRALVPLRLQQVQGRFALFGDFCAYCSASEGLSVDHVLPLSAGGLDEEANIAPACLRCNKSKNDSHVEQWYRRQPFFTEPRWRKIQRHCPGATGQLPLALSEAA